MNKQLKVWVAGHKGYAGQELLKLIQQHPSLSLGGVLRAREEGPKFAKSDVLILATPAEVSADLVAKCLNQGIKIIDLSGAYRLPKEQSTLWYGVAQEVGGAVYGLSPWAGDLSQASLIANPGCYATCALMALIPLLKHQLIMDNQLIIDAKSGASGAGKTPNANLMLCELMDNFFPYKIGHHQHTPEINHALALFTDTTYNVTLTTHMLPIKRGISMSIYAVAKNLLSDDGTICKSLGESYQTMYADYPLVKFFQINSADETCNNDLLSLKSVVGTPFVHIGYFVKDGKVLLSVSLDNLMKGAASQAIENLNAMHGWPKELGLVNELGGGV